ncbi:MAG: hypothetical protein ISS25_00535 [Nanoarchaeota archaeon]|nr:hypothetical protein [DPANN group archaeon]MBL7116303.1 hypothetical protein [Nanoarchaeota archaeon]
MNFINIMQRWSFEVLGLLLIIIPGIILLRNVLGGNTSNWSVYVILIAFGGLLSGFKSIYNNIMRYFGR